jgi:peptidoglycan/xylan/chitin deacetylase (PgdA/CDA1 family)
MSHARPLASVSLDLDNKWSYMKTHGDAGWESFPSYLDLLVPRVLSFIAERKLSITFMIVGQDAALPANREPLGAIAAAGHEIGNHSFHHEPWLHRYSPQQVDVEIERAEEAIESVTGRRPVGFRGPGFSLSPAVLETLARRGYQYDGSTLPTFIGPLARAYYFMTSKLDRAALEQRKALFGSFAHGFQPLRAYRWETPAGGIIEIPVTTMPFSKLPIHVSYLLYLARISPAIALGYFRWALGLCSIAGVEPSLLLHPLDFLGADDGIGLGFFPGMDLPRAAKLAVVGAALDALTQRFHVVTMGDHAAAIAQRSVVRRRTHAASAA